MKTARRVLFAVAVSVAFTATTAAAARIPLSSARVAAGDAAVAACDSDGVTVTYTNSFDTAAADYRTTQATVSAIAATCADHTISLSVRSSTGTALWQGSMRVTSTTAVFAMPPVASASIAGWAIAITG